MIVYGCEVCTEAVVGSKRGTMRSPPRGGRHISSASVQEMTFLSQSRVMEEGLIEWVSLVVPKNNLTNHLLVLSRNREYPDM